MRRKKNKPFRKQILKETETDKISGTDITEKLYQRHPDLEQLWYFCNLQHSAPCWIQRRPQHTGSHQKLKVMSTFMYIILSIYPLFAHLFLPFKEVYHSPLHLLHIIFWDFDLGFSFLNVWIFVLSFFFFLPCGITCDILVPWPAIESMPPALEALSLIHWTAKEVLIIVPLWELFLFPGLKTLFVL